MTDGKGVLADPLVVKTAEKVAKALRAGASQYAMCCYKAGQALKDMADSQSDETATRRSLSAIARELGEDRALLDSCQLVATAFDEEQVKLLLGRPIVRELEDGRKQEYPVGITHLSALARVPSTAAREQLIVKMYDKGMTTRELKAAIIKRLGMRSNNPEGRGIIIRNPEVAVSRLDKTCSDVLKVRDALISRLDSIQDDVEAYSKPEFVRKLEKVTLEVGEARKALDELYATASASLAVLSTSSSAAVAEVAPKKKVIRITRRKK